MFSKPLLTSFLLVIAIGLAFSAPTFNSFHGDDTGFSNSRRFASGDFGDFGNRGFGNGGYGNHAINGFGTRGLGNNGFGNFGFRNNRGFFRGDRFGNSYGRGSSFSSRNHY